MIIKYLSKEKAAVHLKLGRTVVMFIKTDHFFDAITFDWISIKKQENEYKSTLVRSINEGHELFNDVLSFKTLNEDQVDFDEITNSFFIGNLNECFEWIVSTFDVKELKFSLPEHLAIIYTGLVREGAFDEKNR